MGKNTKRKKNFYLAPNKRHRLDTIPGTIGFLGTCNTHEDVCVKEGYSLLNRYADQLYGPEQMQEKPTEKSDQPTEAAVVANPSVADESSDEEDVDAALKKEVSSLQSSSSQNESRAPRRFQAMRCGTSNNVFFRTSLADPLPVLVAAMDDIINSGQQRTRHLIRMLPVHAVCKAYLDKIEKAFNAFCTGHFKGHKKSFYAVVKVMSNSSLKKEDVVNLLLRVMDQIAPECRPVLTKDADVAVVVSVLVTNCYIGEAPLYLDKYKKYNLIELASPAVLPNVEKQSNGNEGEVKVMSEDRKADSSEPGAVPASGDGDANGDSIAAETLAKINPTNDTAVSTPSIDEASDTTSSKDNNVGITVTDTPTEGTPLTPSATNEL